jgi:signal transduction histidine kinase
VAFDRFSRADTSRTTKGTGLGLAIVKAVAEAHAGTASISGAEVTISLPGRRTPVGPASRPVNSRDRRTTA